MRIRRKAWARPELAACPYYIAHPEQQKGQCGYSDSFHGEIPLGDRILSYYSPSPPPAQGPLGGKISRRGA